MRQNLPQKNNCYQSKIFNILELFNFEATER